MEGGFKLLAEPQTLFSVNFEDPEEIASLIEGRLFSLKFNVEEDGRLDCLAGWFSLEQGLVPTTFHFRSSGDVLAVAQVKTKPAC